MEGVREYSVDQLIALLPMPTNEANKYTRGTLIAIVGSARYPGAACLAAYASQRTGAGYTDVFTDPAAVSLVRGYRPSLVVHPWDELSQSSLPATQPTKLSSNPLRYHQSTKLGTGDQRTWYYE